MNLNLLIPLLITTLVAIVGWVAAHYLTAKRDLANNKRELRVKYLIDAYRQLESASNSINREARWTDVQAAIADIQLFGTPPQVELAILFATEIAEKRSASLDNLLFDLRKILRAELQLEPVTSSIKFLRFNHDQIENID